MSARPRLIFHVTHPHHFPLVDSIVQTISLALVAVIPIALLLLAPRLLRTARFA